MVIDIGGVFMKVGKLTCKLINSFFEKRISLNSHEEYSEMEFENAVHKYNLYKKYVHFKDKRVLDFGCGRGGESCFYGVKTEAGEVSGIDIDANSLIIANKFAKKKNISEKVVFKKSHPNSLPFDSNSFDIIVSSNAMEHAINPFKVLEECKRVLKPNGFFCTSFSPLYYSKWGAHIYNYIYFPWPQIFFSEQTIISVIKEMQPASAISSPIRAIEQFQTLNKLTVPKFKNIIEELDFKIVYFNYDIGSRLAYIPVLGNFFITGIQWVLQKPSED